MRDTHVQVEKQGTVGVVRLQHPPANALSQPLFRELAKALDTVEQDQQVKAIVLIGTGRFFAAGADITEFTAVEQAEQGQKISEVGQQLFERIEAFTKPIIAAIHGAALGGGLELAMACHIRFSTANAKLGLPELNLGLIPGFAGTQRLPRLVGKAKALEMMFTSQPITGEEALRLGLVNRVVLDEELEQEAVQFATLIAEKSAVSVRYLLETIHVGEEEGFIAGSQKEAELFGKIFESADAKEGVQAFLEKRRPQFRDQ